MLAADVRFEGWTSESWSRFLHLWKPRASPDREPTRPRGGVLVVHDGSRVRKLVHTRTGRLDPSRVTWPIAFDQIAREHHASWVVAGHFGALEEVMERFGSRVRRGDDLIAQSLKLVSIFQEMIMEGAIESWPRRLHGVPVPTDPMVRRAIDALCPEGHALVLGVFDKGELWTSFTARRRGSGFDVIAGPEELVPAMGLLSGDWRRDYRHLERAVEDAYAPLAFGCFSEVQTFRELQVDPRPGAWGRSVAVRDVLISPVPVAVGLALGFDGARFAFENLKTMTDRLGWLGVFDPVLAGVRRRLGNAAGSKDVATLLGFDPMEVLRALLKR